MALTNNNLMKINSFSDISLSYGTLIVGAGPSGASTAGYLSDSKSVLLIDRNPFPRDKPCGGVLKEESLGFLKGFDLPKDILLEPNHLNLKYLDWDNEFSVDQKRNLINVSRAKFDEWILGLVPDSVDFCDRTEILDFEVDEDIIQVFLEKNNITKTVKCKYLVGATGAASVLRKKLFNQLPTTYIAVQELIKNVDNVRDFIYILDSEITDFYSWIIPKGNLLLVGSAFSTKRGPYREKFELLKEKINDRICELGPVHKKEAALLVKPKNSDELRFGLGNVLLVGEEAGLISPTTAEGISYALKSGKYCAKAINKNSNALFAYTRLCNDLVKDIKSKLKKSELLFAEDSRLELFNSIQSKITA